MNLGVILRALEAKALSRRVRRMVYGYLSVREIQEKNRIPWVTAGVSQGSVLGLALWNHTHGGVSKLYDTAEHTNSSVRLRPGNLGH